MKGLEKSRNSTADRWYHVRVITTTESTSTETEEDEKDEKREQQEQNLSTTHSIFTKEILGEEKSENRHCLN